MIAQLTPPVELLTTWERFVEPLLWYVVPNIMLTLMTSLWQYGNLRLRRRMGEAVAVGSWVAFTLLIGMVLPFVTGPLAHRAWVDAKRRRHNERLWLVLCAAFSFVGYIGYAVYDDADSRRMPATLLAALAMAWYLLVLAGVPLLALYQPHVNAFFSDMKHLLVIIPGVFLLLIAFPALYSTLRTRIRYDDVRSRMDGLGLLDTGQQSLVAVENLKTYFPIHAGVFSTLKGYVRAVDEVSFNVRRGEVLGLVGESGCGKTTVGRTLLGLIPATTGRVLYDGIDLSLVNAAEMRALRSKMQVIFQDPIGSLNPRMTVGGIVSEGLTIHGIGTRAERRRKVAELLERVGLSPEALNRYPHEFSGGQRQRIGIARALALGADFIVCDEPVSALDVSIQAQIINLMRDLQRDFKISYLFIAHDLAVVEHISDRVAVMYLGKVMEVASRNELYAKPLHPYTRALMAAIPTADPEAKKNPPVLKGDIPSPANPPSGCRFRTRCPEAIPECAQAIPPLTDYGGGHQAACIRVKEWLNDAGQLSVAAKP